MTDTLRADVVIVGGGSAGCVLAARSSALAGRSVLLVEAGPAFAEWPAALLDPYSLPIGAGSEWAMHYAVELNAHRSGTVARGRVLGGSGAVNGAYFARALPSDFVDWPGELWTYDAVLPYYRRLETDMDFADSGHGRDGPIPVCRPGTDDLAAISAQFHAACVRAGFAEVADLNGGAAVGVGPVPSNIADGVRVNTALAYLAPAGARDNLTVLDGAMARTLVLDGDRVAGLEVERRGTRTRIEAGFTVLCAGGIESAALLQRSGIGNPEPLRAAGLVVAHELPGVGASFRDHPEVTIPYRTTAETAAATSLLQTVLNTGDIEIRPYTRSFAAAIDGSDDRTTRLGVTLMRAQSRGRVAVRSGDPTIPPHISFGYLDHPADRAAMRAAVEQATDLLRDVGAREIDGDTSDAWLLAHLGTSQHMTGTCRMGPSSDPGAVVDDRCRVHGLRDVGVVDASVIPSAIGRGIHATVVMVAERAADLLV